MYTEFLWRVALVPPEGKTGAHTPVEFIPDALAPSKSAHAAAPEIPASSSSSANPWLRAAARQLANSSPCDPPAGNEQAVDCPVSPLSTAAFDFCRRIMQQLPVAPSGRYYKASIWGGTEGAAAVAPPAAARRLAEASRTMLRGDEPAECLKKEEGAGALTAWSEGLLLMAAGMDATSCLQGVQLFWPQLLLAEMHRRQGRLHAALKTVEEALLLIDGACEEVDVRLARELRRRIIIQSHSVSQVL